MSGQSKAPVKVGGVYSLEITGLSHGGEGVGRFEGFSVFVPGALPSEIVSAKISVLKRNYAIGEIISMERLSPHRALPECGVYQECGGCQIQHLCYQEQLRIKENAVIGAVKRIGKLEGIIVKPCLGAGERWHWRNKMQMPAGNFDGKIYAGCFAKGTHRIITAEKCLIQHQFNNVILEKTLAAINKLGISAYNEETGEGIIRHIMGRVGVNTGQTMVVLVTASREFPNKKRLISLLRESVPNLVGIIQNINKNRGNVIMGEESEVLWGKDHVVERIGELSFELSARTFFQVNTQQAEVLYAKALEYAALTKEETVIDAYCGAGAITLFLARHAGKAYGIEINPAAIADAKRNAWNNNIQNAEFIAGDALKIMPELYRKGVKPDVIVTDPPRAGCDEKVLETFARMDPKRIIYISCNPASLARDLAFLDTRGYIVKEIQPIDIFPQTYHVECIALLTRE